MNLCRNAMIACSGKRCNIICRPGTVSTACASGVFAVEAAQPGKKKLPPVSRGNGRALLYPVQGGK